MVVSGENLQNKTWYVPEKKRLNLFSLLKKKKRTYIQINNDQRKKYGKLYTHAVTKTQLHGVYVF